MKTKILLLTAFTITLTFSLKAQTINKLSKKQVNKIQLNNELKLPLLKATSIDRYNDNNVDKLLSKKLPSSTTTLTPKAYSSSSSALKVTLTSSTLRKSGAGVYFRGSFRGQVKIEGDKKQTYLGLFFNAKRNKTYRVSLSFNVSYNEYACRKPLLFINIGETSQAMSFKEGPNTLDFLVESEVNGRIHFIALSKYRVTCDAKKYTGTDMNFTFLRARIQELVN